MVGIKLKERGASGPGFPGENRADEIGSAYEWLVKFSEDDGKCRMRRMKRPLIQRTAFAVLKFLY